MRHVVALLLFCGLVAAFRLFPSWTTEPGGLSRPVRTTGSIVGQVTRHGYPAVARVVVRRLHDRTQVRTRTADWHPPAFELRDPPVGEGVASVRSKEDGSFRIDDLAPGAYRLTAQGSDGAATVANETVFAGVANRRTRLELPARRHVRVGRLTWADGRPFQGQVFVWWSGGAVTGPDGRFALTLRARAPAPVLVWRRDTIRRVVGDFDPERETSLDFVVDAGLVTRIGRVVSADDGRPLGGVPVVATTARGGRWDCVTMARTTPDGRFRISMVEGDTLAAGDEETITERVKDRGPDEPLTIRLRRRPIVTGRVIDEDGRPVVGVPVRLSGLPDGPEGWVEDLRRAPVLTDREGRFRIAPGRVGNTMVVACGNGWFCRDLPTASAEGYNPLALDLVAGETIETEFVAVRSPSLTGRVTDPSGDPVAGLRIEARRDSSAPWPSAEKGCWPDDLPGGATGPEGFFRISTVPPGVPLRIRFDPPAGTRVQSGIFRVYGESTVDLVAPPPPRRLLEVTVLSAEGGRPVEGAYVHAIPALTEGMDPSLRLRWFHTYAYSGPDGRALVGPLPAGPHVAYASHPRFVGLRDHAVPQSVGASDRLTLTLRLQPGGEIGGRVLAADGSPAPFVRVSFEGASGDRPSVHADSEGRFRARDLAPGDYEVSSFVWRPGLQSEYASLLAATGRTDLVLELVPEPRLPFRPREPQTGGGRISGRVVDPEGNPVRGARLHFRPLGETRPRTHLSGDPRIVVWSGADGRFAIDAPGSGARAIEIDGPPHLRQSEILSAVPGETSLTLRLKDAAQPVITVLDDSGTAVVGASVYIVAEDEDDSDDPYDAPAPLLTGEHGRVSPGGLDPAGTYGLIVFGPRDREDTGRAQIDDWRPADRTVRMERAWTLRGVVKDRDGWPVYRAGLWGREVAGTSTRWESIPVEEDGTFECHRVPFRACELRAWVTGRSAYSEGIVSRRVEPGTGRVVLELDPGRWIGIRVPDRPRHGPVPLRLMWPDGSRELDLPTSGEIRIHGLPAESEFSVYVGPLPGNRMGVRHGLRAGRDHVVPLRSGKVISGRILSPEPVRISTFRVTGGDFSLDLDRDLRSDRYRVAGLPDGEYTVQGSGWSGEHYYEGEVKVRAGETTDLKLER